MIQPLENQEIINLSNDGLIVAACAVLTVAALIAAGLSFWINTSVKKILKESQELLAAQVKQDREFIEKMDTMIAEYRAEIARGEEHLAELEVALTDHDIFDPN